MATQKNPLFAADNLLDQHTTTASSEATDFEKEKAFDGFAFDAWKPSALGNAWLNSLAPGEEIVDYFGIFAHDFAVSKARAQLVLRDPTGHEFPLSIVSTVPSDSRPIFDSFPKVVQNLIVDSENFDDWPTVGTGVTITADVDDDPDGFMRADKIDYNGTGTAGQVNVSVNLPNQKHANPSEKFAFGVWVRAQSGTIDQRLSTNIGAVLDFTATTTWQFVQTPPTLGDGQSTFVAAIRQRVGNNDSFTGLLVAKAIVQRSPTLAAISGYQRTFATPFDVGGKEYRLNILSKHNDMQRSEELDNAFWSQTNVTVTANVGTDPNDTLTAEKVVADITGQCRIERAVTVPSARTVYTWSCYMGRVAASTKEFGALSHFSGTPTNANSFVEVNLTTGAVVASGEALGGQGRLLAHSVEAAGFGMWRVSMTVEVLSTDGSNSFKIHPTDGDSNIDATIGDEIRAWGASLERAPSPGEYQQTTTAAVDNAIGQAGVVNFGEVLEADSGIAPGNQFFPHAGSDEFVTTISQSGQPLGHSLRRMGVEFNVQIQTVNIAWVRANWKNLITALQAKPIFFAWDPDNHPEETVWAWLDKRKPAPPTFISPLHQNTTIRLVGLAE